MAFEITVLAPIGAMGDPNSSDIWVQDDVILEESGSCVFFSYPPKHWNNKPDMELKSR